MPELLSVLHYCLSTLVMRLENADTEVGIDYHDPSNPSKYVPPGMTHPAS